LFDWQVEAPNEFRSECVLAIKRDMNATNVVDAPLFLQFPSPASLHHFPSALVLAIFRVFISKTARQRNFGDSRNENHRPVTELRS